jgi:hypothetical protein
MTRIYLNSHITISVKLLTLMILILLSLISGLFGYQNTMAEVYNETNIPKSYDYILEYNGPMSINTALGLIQTRFNNNEKNVFSIGLSNGVYQESVFSVLMDNSSLYSDLHVSIVGLGTSVQLPGDNFIYADSGDIYFSMVNLSISGGSRGIESLYNTETDAMMHLTMDNCVVFNNSGIYSGTDINMDGTGIYSEGPAMITFCEIYNNVGVPYWHPGIGNNDEFFSKGGGIAVKNDTDIEAVIQNCYIHNNTAIAGGGIFATGSGSILIKNNSIKYNSRNYDIWDDLPMQGGSGEGIFCYKCDDLTLQDNIISNQIASSVVMGGTVPLELGTGMTIESCGSSAETDSVLIENNTIMDNGDCVGMRIRSASEETEVRNNLSCYNKAGIYTDNCDLGMLTVSYNCTYQNWNGYNYLFNGYGIITEHDNYIFDPKVDSQYSPIWNAILISPLIDAGDPALCDPDETPSDIGAVRTGDHEYEEYAMPYGNSTNIRWMSYPVLNRITGGYTTNCNFFEPIVNPLVLDWVEWKEEDDQQIKMYFDAFDLVNGNYGVTSPVGYKVMLKSSVVDEITISTTGHIQSPTTVINLFQYLAGTTTPNENWLGYFLPESTTPAQAFSAVWDYLTYIQTQTWSMSKTASGIWKSTSANPTLNYGDMVIVKATQDCSFMWNNSQPVDPKSIKSPQNFIYTELPEYTPLYIEFEEDKALELPSEIGLYVNGVCKGATVVEGPDAQICAYLEGNEQITPENSELIFWYETKDPYQNRVSCRLDSGTLDRNQDYGNLFYSFGVNGQTGMEQVIPTTSLAQNHPNPFNPSTMISYELAEDGPVCLEVYNMKGQKVAILVNTSLPAGRHSIAWNGTDRYGRTVASGIYHYRLTTNGQSINRKMLLMK